MRTTWPCREQIPKGQPRVADVLVLELRARLSIATSIRSDFWKKK